MHIANLLSRYGVLGKVSLDSLSLPTNQEVVTMFVALRLCTRSRQKDGQKLAAEEQQRQAHPVLSKLY